MNLDELFRIHEGYSPPESMEQRRDYFTWIADATFKAAWKEAGTALIPPSFDMIARAYTEPHRYYHTEVHILHCLHLLLKLCGPVGHYPHEEVLAIFFHDLVYDPRAFDNEKRSATQFETFAIMACMEKEKTDRIMKMIETTVYHIGGTQSEIVLNDIDLSILGAPPPIFAKYEENLRSEFMHLSDEQWRSGRRVVLAEFLVRPAIFRLPFFQDLLEGQARTNILNAINAIDDRF